jgi:hypothetical protein
MSGVSLAERLHMGFLRFAPDSLATTWCGWTPGLKSLVGGRVLPCGCLAGTYDTWMGATVVILDARSARCQRPRHRTHAVLWAGTAAARHPRVEDASTDQSLA